MNVQVDGSCCTVAAVLNAVELSSSSLSVGRSGNGQTLSCCSGAQELSYLVVHGTKSRSYDRSWSFNSQLACLMLMVTNVVSVRQSNRSLPRSFQSN